MRLCAWFSLSVNLHQWKWLTFEIGEEKSLWYNQIRHVHTILQIPIIQISIAVKYIDSKPPTLRTQMITRSRVLGFHPIDLYCNRPNEYNDMTFTDYFKRFDMEKICRRNVNSFGKDKLGFHIYETHKLIWTNLGNYNDNWCWYE